LKTHLKIEIVQQKTDKRYSYRVWIPQFNKAAEEPWTETETKINDLAQANGYEAYSRASKQNWFAGGFVWKWYVDDYKERILITPQENQL
jgi:hypothetical protein